MLARQLGLAAVLSAASLGASAAVVTASVTLDANELVPQSGFTGLAFGSPPFFSNVGVTLAEGDTFQFTIDFAGSQTLTVEGATLLWAFALSDVASGVTGTGTLSLLDEFGSVAYTLGPLTSSEGAQHFGQIFTGTVLAGLPSSVTFSGLYYEGTVDDYLAAGVTSRSYDAPALAINARSITVGSAGGDNGTPVPEPGTGALIALGLAAALLRRGKTRC